MMFLFFWIGFAILCGVFAESRGRSGAGYFVLAIFISPLLTVLLLLCLQNLKALARHAELVAAIKAGKIEQLS